MEADPVRAAGIDTRATVDPAAITEAARHLLGPVVREAATNVLRHSRARTASIEYRVADGVALLRVGNGGAAAHEPGTGTGLSALAERLGAAGGVLRRALAAGVRGFVPKTTSAARLAAIIRDVADGRRYIDPDIAASALPAWQQGWI